MKTNELTGAALDWAVAKCEGTINGDDLDIGFILEGGYLPSTNWAQGGPIIEREKLAICIGWKQWLAFSDDTDNAGVQGPTPLVAAMRCYVVSKLGDNIDIPEELI
jgi:hypothetical protein